MSVDGNNVDRINFLVRLANAADEACAEAVKRQRHDESDLQSCAVNWADLHCVEASYRLLQSGEERHVVLIEEADPGAALLQEFIVDYLATHGFPDIECETEW